MFMILMVVVKINLILFDFSTTSTIQLNVKYDVPEGYKVLFNVYFEDPFTTDEGGQTVLRTDITPAITRMTDENGEYHAKEIVAADHGSDVYIYTSYVGVPGLVQTTITDNVINADIEWKLTDGIPQTRADKWDPSTEYGLLGTGRLMAVRIIWIVKENWFCRLQY